MPTFLPTGPGFVPQAVEHENDHGPDDRKDPAGPGIGRERERLSGTAVDGPVKQAAHERPDPSQENGPQDGQRPTTGEQETGDKPHDEAAQRPTQNDAQSVHLSCPSRTDSGKYWQQMRDVLACKAFLGIRST